MGKDITQLFEILKVLKTLDLLEKIVSSGTDDLSLLQNILPYSQSKKDANSILNSFNELFDDNDEDLDARDYVEYYKEDMIFNILKNYSTKDLIIVLLSVLCLKNVITTDDIIDILDLMYPQD